MPNPLFMPPSGAKVRERMTQKTAGDFYPKLQQLRDGTFDVSIASVRALNGKSEWRLFGAVPGASYPEGRPRGEWFYPPGLEPGTTGFASEHEAQEYLRGNRIPESGKGKSASRERLTQKSAADPSGMYGFTKAIQRSAEAATRKLSRSALKIAKRVFAKDEQVVPFLQAHMKREDSKPARVLLAALKEVGPKLASEMRGGHPKEAGAPEYGLYGFKAKTADLGLDACKEVRATAGRITADLHRRRADQHEKITGFYKTHSDMAKCAYSGMLLSCYPDASMKVAADKGAGGGAGITVLLSGKSRDWKLPSHRKFDDEGFLKVDFYMGEVSGTAKVHDLGIASYEEFAFIREPGHVGDVELNPSEWRVFAGSIIEVAVGNGFNPEDVVFSLFFSEVEDVRLSGGYIRQPAPTDFDVEGVATVTASWGDFTQVQEEIGFTATFSTSPAFKEAWESLGGGDWDEEARGPRRFGSYQQLTGGRLEWDAD